MERWNKKMEGERRNMCEGQNKEGKEENYTKGYLRRRKRRGERERGRGIWWETNNKERKEI